MKKNCDELHLESIVDETVAFEDLRRCCPDLVKDDLVVRFILGLPRVFSVRYQNIVFSSIRQGMGDAVSMAAGYAFRAFAVFVFGLVIIFGISHFWTYEKLLSINAGLMAKEKIAEHSLEARRKELASVEERLAAKEKQLAEVTRNYESLSGVYRSMSIDRNVVPYARGGWVMMLDSSNTFIGEWGGRKDIRFAVLPNPPLLERTGTADSGHSSDSSAPGKKRKGK